MNVKTKLLNLKGVVGNLECKLDFPEQNPLGVVLVAHPHPLFGGSMDNKVVQTLVRAFILKGLISVRMNFRGVGNTDGVYDNGIGETEDMETIFKHFFFEYPSLPFFLSGFSFGTYIQAKLNKRLEIQEKKIKKMLLIGTAVGKWNIPDVPNNTMLIHGEKDEIISLLEVLDWARPQDLAIITIPGADHFFHRKLNHIKNIVLNQFTLNSNE